MYELDNLKHQKKLVDIVRRNKDKSQYNYWNGARDELNKEFGENDNKETWRSRFRFLGEEYKVIKVKGTHAYQFNYDKQARLLNYLKQERTIDFLCKMLDMDEIELLGNIEKLRMDGHDIPNINGSFKKSNDIREPKKVYQLYQGELKDFQICVISDTHLCNKKQQITLLNEVYDECVRRGIKTVLHCGDITDGFYKKREDSIYELFCIGTDNQGEYVINNYPHRDGITTYFITGNHDKTHVTNGGTDVGKMIARSRDDMHYLSYMEGTIMLNNCRIDLFHPEEGSAYAKSYAGQKIIENMQSGDKPNIMFCGHHHKAVYFVDRNVHYCEVPCLCSQTLFQKGHRVGNTVGAMFPRIKIDDLGNVITFVPEMMMFYRMIENDYEIPNNKVYKQAVNIEE